MKFIDELNPYDWRIGEETVDEFIDSFVGRDGRLFAETDKSESEALECWRAIQEAIAKYARDNGRLYVH